MTSGVRLQPVDTLFLRDGTPFVAGSAPQEDVGSLFPPYPTTTAGALRAALARSNGWGGQGRWPARLNAVLGDGPNDFGALKFGGPVVLRDDEPLFPVPRHVLGAGGPSDWSPRALLRPGPGAACDLGPKVRLPQLPPVRDDGRLKPGPDKWLTRAGLKAVLRGCLPGENQVLQSRTLWRNEERIGLKIDRITRTARERRLYSTRHVRVARGVSLGVRIDGVPEGWTLPCDRLIALGGESRAAECRRWDAEKLVIGAPPVEVEATGRVAIIALTPLDIDRAIAAGEAPLEVGGGLDVVSACLDRPRGIGGWDSLARRPLPLRSMLPAGSTLFCEAKRPRRLVRAAETGGGLVTVGMRTEWGFGLAAVGAWPRENDKEMSR